MRRFRNSAFIATALIFVLAVAGAVHAQENEAKIPAGDVPAAVMAAFHNAYPKAELKGTATETKNGTTYFEIESVDGGTSRDLLYLADGTVAEIEEGIDPTGVPGSVKAAAQVKYPQGRIVGAEKTTRGAVVTYVLEIASEKAKAEVTFDPSGKIIEEPTSGSDSDAGKSEVQGADKAND